jgi:prephenate dehydratase
MEEPTFDLDAAGLRADGPELVAAVEVLARKLELSLPRATSVQRRSKRMFSKDKVVESIEVRLGTTRYGLQVNGDRIAADRANEVRGVVIKREQLEVADWLGALAEELREQAADSAEAREALERLVG